MLDACATSADPTAPFLTTPGQTYSRPFDKAQESPSTKLRRARTGFRSGDRERLEIPHLLASDGSRKVQTTAGASVIFNGTTNTPAQSLPIA